jgi:hypothetical protein
MKSENISLFNLNPNDIVYFSDGQKRKVIKLNFENYKGIYYFDLEFYKSIEVCRESKILSNNYLFFMDGKYIEDINNNCNNIVQIDNKKIRKSFLKKCFFYYQKIPNFNVESFFKYFKKYASN